MTVDSLSTVIEIEGCKRPHKSRSMLDKRIITDSLLCTLIRVCLCLNQQVSWTLLILSLTADTARQRQRDWIYTMTSRQTFD